jgi:hypothetical protein
MCKNLSHITEQTLSKSLLVNRVLRRIFEPKTDEVKVGCRNLHNEYHTCNHCQTLLEAIDKELEE